jgi:CheY-like chemotaxis protein
MIVVDWYMPHMDGPAFIKWVRSQPDVALADTPLVLFTGRDEAHGVDADVVLRKGMPSVDRFFDVAKQQIAHHYLEPPKGQRALPFTGFLSPRDFRRWEHVLVSRPPERRRTPRVDPEDPRHWPQHPGQMDLPFKDDPKQMHFPGFGENMDPYDYARGRYLFLLETKKKPKKPKVGVGTIAYHAGRGVYHSAQAAIGAGISGASIASLNPDTRGVLHKFASRVANPDVKEPEDPSAYGAEHKIQHNTQQAAKREKFQHDVEKVSGHPAMVPVHVAAAGLGAEHAHKHGVQAYDAFKTAYQAARHRFGSGPPPAAPKAKVSHPTKPLSQKAISAAAKAVKE